MLSTSTKNVLIVDDSKFTIKEIKTAVENGGFTVVSTATNGLNAIEEYKKYKPDIVTMDLTMPELDGISAIKEILAFDKNAKIIAISALEHPEKIQEAISAGCCEYIIKPVDEKNSLILLNTF